MKSIPTMSDYAIGPDGKLLDAKDRVVLVTGNPRQKAVQAEKGSWLQSD